jgi:hypothetical protein
MAQMPMAIHVILLQNSVALDSILRTSISIDSFVSVQAAAKTTSVASTILRPVTTWETGMSYTWRIQRNLTSARMLMTKKPDAGIYPMTTSVR